MSKTLWDLTQGEDCLVEGFAASLDDDYRIRLMELGFHPGEKVSCIQVPSMGAPRLYRVHNTVYSLDDRIANLVAVRRTGRHE